MDNMRLKRMRGTCGRGSREGTGAVIAVMVIVCLASALAKLAYSVDHNLRIAVAVGMGALVLAGIAAAITSGSWTKWYGDKCFGST